MESGPPQNVQNAAHDDAATNVIVIDDDDDDDSNDDGDIDDNDNDDNDDNDEIMPCRLIGYDLPMCDPRYREEEVEIMPSRWTSCHPPSNEPRTRSGTLYREERNNTDNVRIHRSRSIDHDAPLVLPVRFIEYISRTNDPRNQVETLDQRVPQPVVSNRIPEQTSRAGNRSGRRPSRRSDIASLFSLDVPARKSHGE